MKVFKKSHKLDDICYDIRGPVMEESKRLEQEGYHILKLNIGNPAPFGLEAPNAVTHDVIMNLKDAEGYCDSKGLFSARRAIVQDCQNKGIHGTDVDDVYTGNGVSELIVMSMQALLNSGDEVLIPAPDYPLWTAAVRLAGGTPVHYLCDEESDWVPDLKDIQAKVSAKTKAIVVINPNNPTGAVYPKEVLEGIVQIARENNLIVMSDEIYDRILYDGAKHIPMASLAEDLFFITFNGLSKSHRLAGFRAGWMVLSGKKSLATDYIEGLNMMAAMRLCSNVPAQLAIQTALGENESLREMILPNGRLLEQRNFIYKALSDIPGISCVKPQGAFYLFPKIDTKKFNIKNDQQFVLDLLLEEKVLLVQGTGFNWHEPNHFRLVFLPTEDVLRHAAEKLEHFLKTYRQ